MKASTVVKKAHKTVFGFGFLISVTAWYGFSGFLNSDHLVQRQTETSGRRTEQRINATANDMRIVPNTEMFEARENRISQNEERSNALPKMVGQNENRIEAIDRRIGQNEERFNALAKGVGQNENWIESFDKRIGRNEDRFNAIERRIGLTEERFGQIEKRDELKKIQIDEHERKVAKIEARFNKIETERMDGIDTPLNKIERRFQERRKVMIDRCKELKPPSNINAVKGNMKFVNSSTGLVYCSVEKTGSSFWRLILQLAGGLKQAKNNTNPMKLGIGLAYIENKAYISLKNKSQSQIKTIIDHSNNLMFARDPFTRLFSGWLDKLYSTNPYYWDGLGAKIIKTERQNANEKSLKCGHDVTFPEFANYMSKAIKQKKIGDGHFQSTYTHCEPCNYPFQYYGKYETFEEDTRFLIKKLNLSDKVKFSDFGDDAAGSAIQDAVSWIFGRKTKIDECMSFRCGLFRVWTRLQCRGMISRNSEFPYKTNIEANSTTADEFKAKIYAARAKSDPNELKQAREETTRMVFASLDQSVINSITDAFDDDFRLFGYDKAPEYIRQSQLKTQPYPPQCPFD